VRLWWEVARRGFSRFATYRAATFAGAFTNTVFGCIKAYILIAVYEQRDRVGQLDLVDALTFTFVAQGFLMVVGVFGGHGEIGERIRSGDIVTDFYRPVDFLRYWLALDLGRATFQTIFRGLPPFLVGSFLFHLRLPESAVEVGGFLVSLVLAVTASFAVRFMLGMTAFWLLDSRGPAQVVSVSWLFFAGFILPIDFFPAWLETVARALPFAAMLQVPIEVFLGKHVGVDLLTTLAQQLAWVVVLLAAARLTLMAATRRVVVQGG
jgi:ABC-2 type transport system permease protein